MNQMNLKMQVFEDGLSVKELKDLLKSERDENIIHIGTPATKPVKVVMCPTVRDSDGQDIENTTGMSLILSTDEVLQKKSGLFKKASFSKWFNSTKLIDIFEEWLDGDTVVAEIPDDYWTAESITKLLEKAFEAGYISQQEMKS